MLLSLQQCVIYLDHQRDMLQSYVCHLCWILPHMKNMDDPLIQDYLDTSIALDGKVVYSSGGHIVI